MISRYQGITRFRHHPLIPSPGYLPPETPTMTFLEFVTRKLLGPPSHSGGSPGDSYWCCPFHDDSTPSFHTLPHKPRYRDFWKCWGCGRHGDVFQLLRDLRDLAGHPAVLGDYGTHQALVAGWRREFDHLADSTASTERKEGSAGPVSPAVGSPPSFLSVETV